MCELVCCSWEGGGVSLPVVTLSNDVLCTAPSTHPLHHSTMHNAQNVLKCTFLYPPTVASQPPHCHESKVFTMQPTQLRCTHQKSKSIVLPPCRPMLYSSTASPILGAPLFLCGSNVESASLLVSLLVCAGPGRKGSRYSDICAGAICTTQHTDTHGLTTCVCTHTDICASTSQRAQHTRLNNMHTKQKHTAEQTTRNQKAHTNSINV